MHSMLRELEIELSYYLEEQHGPRAWRESWLRVIDDIAEPFSRAPGAVTDLAGARAPARSVTTPEAALSSYDRLLGDAVPSRWEPSGFGLDEFLRRYRTTA